MKIIKSFLLASCLLAHLQIGSARITSDLTCGNDADCQIRSRSPNSFCSFATGEFRHGVPSGWCHNGPVPLIPQFKTPRPLIRERPAPIIFLDNEQVTKVEWDYMCGNDADCQIRGFSQCSFASGEFRHGIPRGWCRPQSQSIPIPIPSNDVDPDYVKVDN